MPSAGEGLGERGFYIACALAIVFLGFQSGGVSRLTSLSFDLWKYDASVVRAERRERGPFSMPRRSQHSHGILIPMQSYEEKGGGTRKALCGKSAGKRGRTLRRIFWGDWVQCYEKRLKVGKTSGRKNRCIGFICSCRRICQ